MAELIFEVSKGGWKATIPHGIRCECGQRNPVRAKYCIQCGKALKL